MFDYRINHSNIKLHFAVLIIAVIAELIGMQKFNIGIGTILLLPFMVMAGLFIAKIAPFYLPSIAWISIISVGLTLPISPVAKTLLPYISKVAFLPLASTVLAYAGLAIARREIETFKTAGWKIFVIGILVFIGSYMGPLLSQK